MAGYYKAVNLYAETIFYDFDQHVDDKGNIIASDTVKFIAALFGTGVDRVLKDVGKEIETQDAMIGSNC